MTSPNTHKWYRCCGLVTKLCLTLCDPMVHKGPHQVPLSVGFPREEDCSELPFPSPRDSSWPRDQTYVSCIGKWILYHWTTTEARISSMWGIFNLILPEMRERLHIHTEKEPLQLKINWKQRRCLVKICVSQWECNIIYWAFFFSGGCWVKRILSSWYLSSHDVVLSVFLWLFTC